MRGCRLGWGDARSSQGGRSDPTHQLTQGTGRLGPPSLPPRAAVSICTGSTASHSLAHAMEWENGHAGGSGWVQGAPAVATLSHNELGKGLLEPSLGSQAQGGGSPSRAWCVTPQTPTLRPRQAAGMQAATPACVKAALSSASPSPWQHGAGSKEAPLQGALPHAPAARPQPRPRPCSRTARAQAAARHRSERHRLPHREGDPEMKPCHPGTEYQKPADGNSTSCYGHKSWE